MDWKIFRFIIFNFIFNLVRVTTNIRRQGMDEVGSIVIYNKIPLVKGICVLTIKCSVKSTDEKLENRPSWSQIKHHTRE